MKITENKIKRAVTQLSEYFRAVKIPFHRHNRLFSVQGVNGSTMNFEICIDGVLSDAKNTPVDINEITHKDLRIAISTFQNITEIAGYGKLTPVNRGFTNGKKVRVTQSFELSAMRHSELRRTPNPLPSKFEEFGDVISNVVKSYCSRRGREFLVKFGIDYDDLMQYARLWATTYFGLYENPDDSLVDRKKMLYCNLTQRFSEFTNLLYKKSRSCTPSGEVFRISIGLPGHAEKYDAFSQSIDDSFFEELQTETKPVKRTRSSLKQLLNKLLSEMPHDKMVEKLNSIAKDSSNEASKAAKFKLQSHKNNCEQCRSL
ncbi:hypothetical protein EBZ38_08490 [bacterium]|nr:hypothetical protein [bacterium]